MKKMLLLLSIFLQTGAIQAQEDTAFLQVGKIGNDLVDFTVDNLGNLYTLDKDNQLKKLTANGDSVGVFNNVRQYGKVYSIDATNPLKILLFYKDFGTIVVLDRFLNVRNTIDIRKQGIFQAKAIAQSFDNNTWVYDEQEAKLKRIDDNGAIIDQSADFRQFLESAPSPTQIIDQDRLLYLYDPSLGLFVFDYLGSLKNKIDLLGWKDFQVIGTNIYGRKGTVFERYQLNSFSLKEKEMSDKLEGAEKIKIFVNSLYSLKGGTITIYKM